MFVKLVTIETHGDNEYSFSQTLSLRHRPTMDSLFSLENKAEQGTLGENQAACVAWEPSVCWSLVLLTEGLHCLILWTNALLSLFK